MTKDEIKNTISYLKDKGWSAEEIIKFFEFITR